MGYRATYRLACADAGLREMHHEPLHENDVAAPMNRALAHAIISQAAACDRDRLEDAIAKVARSLEESGRYSTEEIRAAIRELLAEVNQDWEPRH